MKKLIFIIKFCKKDFLLYFVGDILNNLAPLIIGFIFKIIIDYYDIINIIQIVMLLFVLLVFNIFSSFISSSKTILYDNLNFKIKYKLQKNLISKLSNIEISYFDKAEFIEKMNNGLKISNGMLTQNLVNISSTISIFISSFLSFFIVFNTSWLFLLFIIMNCLINYLFERLKSNVNYKKDIFVEKDNIENSYYQSLFGNKDSIKEMNVFDTKTFFIDKAYSKSMEIQIKKDKYDWKINFFSIINYIFSFIFQLLCGIVLIIQIQNKKATTGDFFYLLGLYSSLSVALNVLLNTRLESKQLNKYLKHYNDLFDMTEMNNNLIDFNSPVLECKNVSFKYDDNSSFALEDINLKFKGNEKVAIIGENGAGKSSLVKLLAGIYSPTSGEILLNNVKVSNNLNYFTNITITFQDYFKFAFDVKTNICLSDIQNTNTIRLNETIDVTNINNIINDLPYGLDTYLTNEYKKGIDLSEGQWQRIKLAKMIYKNSNIVFMDEPTAAIDAIQEYNLFKMISNITKNKMTFLVSHRIGFAKLADRIIVLQDGKIVEDGTHDELIQKKGIYYNMYEGQAKMYKDGVLNE